jgi:hypothetical protein
MENFTRHQQKSIIVNHTLSLLCPAIGLPKPNILWFYNGHDIHLDKKHIFTKQNGKKLIINKIKVKNQLNLFNRILF